MTSTKDEFNDMDTGGMVGMASMMENAQRQGTEQQTAQRQAMESLAPGNKAIEMLMDVNLQLMVELGRTRMTLRQVLDLQKGSVVELNRIAGDVVDIYVNDHLIAKGEVVVVDDKFGVRVTEIVSRKRDGI